MTTNNGAGGLVAKWREESKLLEKSFDPSNTIIAVERRWCARELEAALQAPGEAVAHSVVAGEVRRNDDGSLDEVCGFGRYHLEQMHNCGWSLRLGRHLISLHATRVIKASIIENDLDDEPQSTTPPPSDVLRRVVEALERLREVSHHSSEVDWTGEGEPWEEADEALAAHKALAEGVDRV